MNETPSQRFRRRAGYAMLALFVLGLVWYFSPGLPLLFGPWATAATKEAGKELFVRKWQPNDELAHGDGLGPVFNETSCVACHFQGGIGGGGHNMFNVTSYEVHPTKDRPEVKNGILHAYAVNDTLLESDKLLQKVFPVVPGFIQITGNDGCRYTRTIPDFNPVRMNAVNTTALFGAGWIDRISGRAISNKQMGRLVQNTLKEFELDFNSIPAGRARILSGGRIGKFGWKAQFATLKEFVAAACANELGLGNPVMEQATPLADAEYAAVEPDLTKTQFKQLVAFVDTLPRPIEVEPANSNERDHAARGKLLFNSIGCAACHTPELSGVKGVYSDFMLHKIRPFHNPDAYDNPASTEIPLPLGHPAADEWKTPPLWGVADSAPYFHDGGSATLEDAIARHGGDATVVTKAYQKLGSQDQHAIVAFLKTLKAPTDALPVPAETRVAQR